MKHFWFIFGQVLFFSVSFNTSASDRINENSPKREIIQFEVSIPELPSEWRLPTREELDHIMRPQASHLFPDYFSEAYIDGDSHPETILLAVRTDYTKQGLLVYVSSLGEWKVLETETFSKSEKIDMTMHIEQCGRRALIFVSPLGRPGNIYHWDKDKKDFIREAEDSDFE